MPPAGRGPCWASRLRWVVTRQAHAGLRQEQPVGVPRRAHGPSKGGSEGQVGGSETRGMMETQVTLDRVPSSSRGS